MSVTVQIIRNTDRVAPDGTWRVGDLAEVSVEEARELVATGRAKLPPGGTLPEAAIAPAFETASLDGGETPGAETAARPRARKRG